MEIKSHNLKKQSPSTERCAIQHHSHHLVVPVGGLSIFKEGEMKLLNNYKRFESVAERIEYKKRQLEKFKMKEYDNILYSSIGYVVPAVCIGLLVGIVLLISSCSIAHADTINPEKLADAIYRAEGGAKAQYPYGIRSVKCDTVAECRKICINTIKANVRRWNKYGHRTHDSFLAFLASRYAPVKNATNDPKKLNRHWLKNVSYFLGGAS